jgi:hypothetical protein
MHDKPAFKSFSRFAAQACISAVHPKKFEAANLNYRADRQDNFTKM